VKVSFNVKLEELDAVLGELWLAKGCVVVVLVFVL
jgi:hypothetical protein